MPTRSRRTGIEAKKKDNIDPERPPGKNRPKQLQTHNEPTYEEKNTNKTNKGKYLQVVNEQRIVSWGAV